MKLDWAFILRSHDESIRSIAEHRLVCELMTGHIFSELRQSPAGSTEPSFRDQVDLVSQLGHIIEEHGSGLGSVLIFSPSSLWTQWGPCWSRRVLQFIMNAVRSLRSASGVCLCSSCSVFTVPVCVCVCLDTKSHLLPGFITVMSSIFDFLFTVLHHRTGNQSVWDLKITGESGLRTCWRFLM